MLYDIIALSASRALLLVVLLLLIFVSTGITLLVLRKKKLSSPENIFDGTSSYVANEKKVLKGETSTKVENLSNWEHENTANEKEVNFPYAQGIEGVRSEQSPNVPPELIPNYQPGQKAPKKISRKEAPPQSTPTNSPIDNNEDDWNV